MADLSTQRFLEVDQVREGIIILKNKALRGVLMVSSINLALKAEEEQKAVFYQFQDFLNSLDFSCQILVQSRRLNITGYLEKLKELERKQTNDLLKIQTADYRKFISQMVETGVIFTKNFFVVVPYVMGEGEDTGKTKKPAIPVLTEEVFQRCKSQLLQRMEFAALGLRRCGLQSVPLTTPEIIELLWSLHHPNEAESGYYPELPTELIT